MPRRFVLVLLLAALTVAPAGQAAPHPLRPVALQPNRSQIVSAPPVLSATAAVLMDARSGRVLYELAPRLRWPPASTTKMMTALLVTESLSDDTIVPVSARAAAERSGSAIGLEAGERWKVSDLLYALLMHSANDAAVALAEAVSGSVEAFAAEMNARARALGARDTHFVTPHGRYHPDHYSSAYDLALIARAAVRVKRIAEIVRTQAWGLVRGDRPARVLINTNKLLWRYAGADGVKTGWIAQSGECLVASATRGGWQLIAVVLNAPQMYADAKALLDYGFENFAPLRAAASGQIISRLPIPDGVGTLVAVVPEEVVAVVRPGASISTQVKITRTTAPIARGEVVGAAVFTSQGVEVARSPLVARDAVPVRSLWALVWRWMKDLVDGGSGHQP